MVFDGIDKALRKYIARDAHFERQLRFGKVVHEFGILHRCDAVSDAFGAEKFDRVPHGFRSDVFARVCDCMKAVRVRTRKYGFEIFCRALLFGSSESDADDVFTRVLLEQFVIFHRVVAAECPRYVEQEFYDDVVLFFDLRDFFGKERNHFAVVESFF